MKRVWFNHWFSTAYHIIGLMRENNDITVIGSNRNPDSVISLACDEWYTEPSDISGDEYVSFCLDFCREHDIDVFVPRRGMTDIAKNSSLFEKQGVLLFLDTDAQMLDILSSKTETYRFFEGFAPECIPEYYEVRSLDEFMNAYKKITASYERACFKLSGDEGAVSFRVIDNTMTGAEGLYKAPGLKVSIETAENIFSCYDFSKSVLVMPYLSGTEVSADCLYTDSGSIIIPRFKDGGRFYSIRNDSTIISLCRRFLEKSGLKMPCNVQFRFYGDTPYLLEVNTRMSGGIQLSCLGGGVNIPSLALGRLLGKEVCFSDNIREGKVSYIESPVLIEEKNAVLM